MSNPRPNYFRFISADINGDGFTDVMGLGDYGPSCTNITGWLSTASLFAFKNDLWNSFKNKSATGNATTSQLKSLTNNSDAAINYTYDKNGNIETISEGAVQKAKYYYDEMQHGGRFYDLTNHLHYGIVTLRWLTMPRTARRKSESGIYHVMLRGINQQVIFEDEEDNRKFLEVLNDCKAVCGYKLFAYCLMGNHIHLLIKTEQEDLEQIFKRIGGRFVYWYNGKYSRAGHLFQDRYKSEPVETDEYFLAVLRYIHQNPVNAGLSKTAGDYAWSSYNAYINPKPAQLTNTEFALEMIGKVEFVKFNNQVNDDKCLEIEAIKFRLTDEQAKKVIIKISKCNNASEFQVLDIEERDKYIKALKEKDLSVRQISRLTGINFGIVRRI